MGPSVFQVQVLKVMQKNKRISLISSVVGTALWLATLVHAQTSVVTNQPGVNSRIDVLGSVFTPVSPVGATQSRIVLYRSANAAPLAGATGVFINGQYHTSLVPGGYSQLCLPPGQWELGARQFSVGQNARDRYDSISAMALAPAQTQYVAVVESAGRPVMKPVPSVQALQELGSARLQIHTISRVTQAQNCVEVAAPVVAQAVPPDQYTLSSDTLFLFGRSDLNGLTTAGRESLDVLTARIQKEYVRMDRLHVVGHADPLGSAVFNERLSVNRANTVRQYLKTKSQITAPITSEGKGDRQLVETRCGRAPTSAAIACHQPNRRVVTEVTGQRR